MKKIWIKEKFYELGMWSIFMLVGGLGTIAYYKWVEQPFGIGDILVTGVLILLFGIGIIKAILVLLKLASGPPSAGVTPEDTVKKFFKAVMVAYGTLDLATIRSDAMFTLSPKASNDIGGWDGFTQYWTQENNGILEKLTKLCAPSPINKALFKLEEVHKIDSSIAEHQQRKVTVNYTVYSGLGTTLNPEKDIGTWAFYSICTLKQDDDLWYITNPKMTMKS